MKRTVVVLGLLGLTVGQTMAQPVVMHCSDEMRVGFESPGGETQASEFDPNRFTLSVDDGRSDTPTATVSANGSKDAYQCEILPDTGGLFSCRSKFGNILNLRAENQGVFFYSKVDTIGIMTKSTSLETSLSYGRCTLF